MENWMREQCAKLLRGIALGRKSWFFAGSDRGGQRAAALYSLIVTAKMNDVAQQAWLADILTRIADGVDDGGYGSSDWLAAP